MPTISITTKKVPAKTRKATATSYQQALTATTAAVSPYAAAMMQPTVQSVAVSQQQKAINTQNTTPTTKPTNPTVGQSYFDTHLGIPLYWNGLYWTDHSGAKVCTVNILGTETTVLEASSITIQIPTDSTQSTTDSTQTSENTEDQQSQQDTQQDTQQEDTQQQNTQQDPPLTVIMGTIDITQEALDTDTLTVTIPYVTADITISYPST